MTELQSQLIGVLHIDGGTATGKDTVASKLKPVLDSSTGLNWKIKTGSLSEQNPYQELARGLNRKGITHQSIFTTLALLSLGYDIKHANPDEPTILAGFNALRSAALHESQDTKLKQLFLKVLRDSSPNIKSSYLLEATLEERKNRLLGRIGQQTKNDLLLLTSPDEVLKADATLLRLGVKYLGSRNIDTTSLTPTQIAERIAKDYLQMITKDI